jgi:hypothetical protein
VKEVVDDVGPGAHELDGVLPVEVGDLGDQLVLVLDEALEAPGGDAGEDGVDLRPGDRVPMCGPWRLVDNLAVLACGVPDAADVDGDVVGLGIRPRGRATHSEREA